MVVGPEDSLFNDYSVTHLKQLLQTFGLSVGCTEADLRLAYLSQVKKLHPDVGPGGNPQSFIRMQEEYKQACNLLRSSKETVSGDNTKQRYQSPFTNSTDKSHENQYPWNEPTSRFYETHDYYYREHHKTNESLIFRVIDSLLFSTVALAFVLVICMNLRLISTHHEAGDEVIDRLRMLSMSQIVGNDAVTDIQNGCPRCESPVNSLPNSGKRLDEDEL